MNGSFWNLCVLAQCWAGVSYLRCSVLMNPRRGKKLSTVAILLYRFLSCWCLHVVSVQQSIVCLHTFFWLTRSLVDPTLTAFIVCGPLQLLICLNVHSFLNDGFIYFALKDFEIMGHVYTAINCSSYVRNLSMYAWSCTFTDGYLQEL